MKKLPITRQDFTCEQDFMRVNDFLSETYRLYKRLHNWDCARWTFNRYGVHGKEEVANHREWEQYAQIWQTSDQQIVGVAHIEEPGEYFFQVHPHYTHLEEEMLLWARETARDKLIVHAHSSDTTRKALYKKHHAIKLAHTDYNRSLVLREPFAPTELPTGFRFIQLNYEDAAACEKLSRLYSRIWPTSTYISNGKIVSSLATSPTFRKELTFIVVDPDNNFAAYCIVWPDTLNRVGHFYPIGTDPDYVGMNLNQAVITQALNTLINLDYRQAYIGAYYDEEDEAVFRRLGFQALEFEEFFEIP
ncbi:MAG: hypothetical protein H6662_20355 [Ardenticatenaceae bacterium]|nr:hypothetical protein [Ardenticatenaceae bacterium]MCB8990947.1 hypothetical protein [Ardenticatenaceae bacterium]MCB9004402.1 hypothetical protein [Ardenticatenaceae bacterium]